MSHNPKMLEDKTEKRKQCNCRDKCMVDGNCLLTNFIYRATEIASKKVSSMLAYQVYPFGTHHINVLLTTVNTDKKLCF